jgi:cell division protein ZapA
MTDKTVDITIELLGKLYPVRCPQSEATSLHQAAAYLNQKMQEVQESGKVLGIDRIAVITALNIAHQFLSLEQQKNGYLNKINQRIVTMQDKIEDALQITYQTELAYFNE